MASGSDVSFLFSISIKLAIQVDRSSNSASFQRLSRQHVHLQR
jgi:hypothetical protein